MRRKISLFLALGLMLTLLLSGCKGKAIPTDMDEATLITQGREIVTLLAAEDWQAVYDRMRADGRAQSSVADIQSYMQSLVDQYGLYVEEKDSMVTGQKLDGGEEYATAVFYCKHEKKNVVYRIAFSTDMELMGFQAKKQSLFG